jgi:hypothetical protein
MDNKNINKILRENLVDATYYKRYYQTSKLSDVINCPLCKRSVTSQKLKRHQITRICTENRYIAIFDNELIN